MTVIFFLLPITLGLVILFVLGFIWASKKGQYDDLETPAHRILLGDEENKNNPVE